MKTHPTPEEWMEYLYGEMDSPQRKSLETHLKACAPCRDKKIEFGGTMDSLDAWRVEVREKHSLASGRQRFQPIPQQQAPIPGWPRRKGPADGLGDRPGL